VSAAPKSDSGFALITALWAALLLGLLASYVVMASRTDARITRTLAGQARQRAVADGMIARTELRLLGPLAAQVRLDGAPADISYAGYHGVVRVQDQAGLIDLNFADADTLARAAQVLGGEDEDAARATADRILDWREQGPGKRLNGAKGPEYQAAHYAYGPRQGRFQTVEELKLVLGMPEAPFDRMAPALTVYSQKELINPDTAPLPVLLTMPGVTEDAARTMISQRALAGSGTGAQLGTMIGTSLSISIKVCGGIDGLETAARTTLRLTGVQQSPFWFY
jgi:general secretion pathway protein K